MSRWINQYIHVELVENSSGHWSKGLGPWGVKRKMGAKIKLFSTLGSYSAFLLSFREVSLSLHVLQHTSQSNSRITGLRLLWFSGEMALAVHWPWVTCSSPTSIFLYYGSCHVLLDSSLSLFLSSLFLPFPSLLLSSSPILFPPFPSFPSLNFLLFSLLPFPSPPQLWCLMLHT